MEIDEMKVLWQDLGEQLKRQQLLTDKIIIQMTKERFYNKLGTISRLESIGAIFCFGIALAVLLNISKLDTWYLMTAGIFTIAFYILYPILSVKAIRDLSKIDIAKNDYKQTIIDYTVRRKKFLIIQKTGILLCFVLVIVSLPVALKIIDGKDLFLGSKIWYWYIPIAFTFLFFFGRWGYSSYSRITDSAEHILNELKA